jgi:RNA polymerase sigma factor (sigma-70 family)
MTGAGLAASLRHLGAVAAATDNPGRTDRELLHDYLGHKDQAAFAVLVKRHGPLVLGVCRRELHSREDADDAFQGTFLLLAQKAASIRRGESLPSWLHGVAFRMARNARRAAARRRKHEGKARPMEPAPAAQDVAWREVQAVLDDEIQRLPAAYRAPFILCFLDGRSRAEAAAELGLKEKSFERRLGKARALLRDRLAQRGVSLSALLGSAAIRSKVNTTVVSALLLSSTVGLAKRVAVGGSAPAKIASLLTEVSKDMFVNKLKLFVVCILALGIAVGGGAFLTYRGDPSGDLAAAPAPPERKEAPRKLAFHAVPAPVVEKKAPRVLLAASAPTREFQFVRALLIREAEAKRAEVSTYLQSADAGGDKPANLPAHRQLTHFPDVMERPDAPKQDPAKKYYNLRQYDVVVAFDLDWSRLTDEQMKLLKKWVATRDGGLIVIGGPIHTFKLARPAAAKELKPILDLLPIVPEDKRLLQDRAKDKPWRLNFPGAKSDLPFLKLERKGKKDLAGWEEFFTGHAKEDPKAEVERGFYDFYPVRKVKKTATVIATFGDPKARMKDGGAQPYLVAISQGKSKVFWIGSGESWRLRQYKTAYHEHFWVELVKYVGAGPWRSDKKQESSRDE